MRSAQASIVSRMVLSGNSREHTGKLFDAAMALDVPGGEPKGSHVVSFPDDASTHPKQET